MHGWHSELMDRKVVEVLSLSLSLCLSLSLPLSLSLSRSLSLSLCDLSIYLSTYRPTCLPTITYLPPSLSVCLSIWLSTCLSVYLCRLAVQGGPSQAEPKLVHGFETGERSENLHLEVHANTDAHRDQCKKSHWNCGPSITHRE